LGAKGKGIVVDSGKVLSSIEDSEFESVCFFPIAENGSELPFFILVLIESLGRLSGSPYDLQS